MIASWALLLLMFIGFALLIGIVALIKHGHGGKLAIMGVLVVALPFITWMAAHQHTQKAAVAQQLEAKHKTAAALAAKLEKELDEFTKPQIELGEETPLPQEEAKPVEKPEINSELELKAGEPLPDWVTDPPENEEGVWQRVVATEPCFTLESLARSQEKLVNKVLTDYWGEKIGSTPEKFSRWLDNRTNRPEAIFDQHTEHRETSVGEAFVSHILFRIGEPENEWFSQQWEAWKTEERLAGRKIRVAGIGLLSGAVLCTLGVLYGLLRMGEK